MNIIHAAGLLLGMASISYLLIAIWRVLQFQSTAAASPSAPTAVTVMIPVCGATPRLAECLRSCCEQNRAYVQYLFGLHHADDAGRQVIERIMRDHPDADMQLVIDATRIGSNPKVCNLANMYRAARHDVLVMIDSDVIVGPEFLDELLKSFDNETVGAATCLYKGIPESNLASLLGALHINDWFLPSALVDLGWRRMDICFGAVMAVTRQALEAIGGFAALANAVAEDDVLGERVHSAGYEVRLSNYVVGTIVAEANLDQLTQHELRWMRSVRACRPLDHSLSLVVHPLLPTAAMILPQPHPAGIAILSTMITLRCVLNFAVWWRLHTHTPASWWLIGLRELLTFRIWLTSFFSRTMRWGSVDLKAIAGRQMTTQIVEKSL
ncbi:MAG: bacteriohopanetetrol glucosamine biosynthesis glycosyltransferase HpnI [Gammaproteobacteria bacterium]